MLELEEIVLVGSVSILHIIDTSKESCQYVTCIQYLNPPILHPTCLWYSSLIQKFWHIHCVENVSSTYVNYRLKIECCLGNDYIWFADTLYLFNLSTSLMMNIIVHIIISLDNQKIPHIFESLNIRILLMIYS